MKSRWRGRSLPLNEAWTTAERLDALARDIRSGTTLRLALERATQEHPALDPAANTAHHSDVAIAHQAIVLAARLDGHEAACLHHAASLLRERAALADEATAHAAAAWASARLLTVLPGVVVVWSTLTSASFREAMASPAGRVCATVGALANLLGWRWMRHIVAGVSP